MGRRIEIRSAGAPEVKALAPSCAALLEIAARLASAWAGKDDIDGWSPESTAANLRDIAEARGKGRM